MCHVLFVPGDKQFVCPPGTYIYKARCVCVCQCVTFLFVPPPHTYNMFVPGDKHHTHVEGDEQQYMCKMGGTNIQYMGRGTNTLCYIVSGWAKPILWGPKAPLGGEAPNLE